ncbi:endonuclease I family protein [Photobacterium aquimaris]|uniref:Endonuclease I n=1 Tax=Photobacterium aquimaris TaxID=512643 RepID=A0A2T3I0J0_9GAMM|nr:endonuclease [Photobacterium aquimaris]OBU25600.1 endonuclease I [Photobacterium aquimaris]PQJ37101.1 endonuclease I [Photobacterium aquimaris]PSU10044.1 endonuclease I [Photobacterium aquimaris]
MKLTRLTITILAAASSCSSFASGITGNTHNDSFNKAKKIMQHQIYTQPTNMKTLYCNAQFDSRKNITLPTGFINQKWKKRALRWEAEHIVPMENIGRSFKEWREGSPQCVDKKGKSFKGRNCASKVSKQYRYIQADLHNLSPAIGSVNAAHSNYRWAMMPNAKSIFGSCDFRYDTKKRIAQPPENSRGEVARASMYMEYSYPMYRLSSQQKKMMQAWDKQDPVSSWECERNAKIKAIQGNDNPFVSKHCK